MRFHPLLSRLVLSTAAVFFVSAGPTRAALVAYEGFDYAPDVNLNGLNGGTGWGSTWSTSFGPPTMTTSAGLTFGNLAVTGGAATTPLSTDPDPGHNVAIYPRLLANAAGPDFYLSFLLRPETDFGFYGGFNLGDLFAGKSGPVPGYSVESCLPACGNIAASGVAAQAGVTTLLVVHALSVAGADNDIFELFVNPVPGAAQPALADATLTGFDFNPTTAFQINNASAWTMDEIRLGETFADVTPVADVPAPPVALLVAGGLLAAIAVRRRSEKPAR